MTEEEQRNVIDTVTDEIRWLLNNGDVTLNQEEVVALIHGRMPVTLWEAGLPKSWLDKTVAKEFHSFYRS